MNILDLSHAIDLSPKRKASTHGGEYCSPCPFCCDGDDRFLIWPYRHNKNGSYQGGRYSCRVCGKYGDAITFLHDFHKMPYVVACAQLGIEPKQQSKISLSNHAPQLAFIKDPPSLWKEKAMAFVRWSHAQLMKSSGGVNQLRTRGFTDNSISSFCLGFNPQTFFREREDWGLASETKENGQQRKLWLPAGLVIPTFSANGEVIKIKIRRLGWKEGDEWPKYVEVSGSKRTCAIYGNSSLTCSIILESELDALLIQQEAGDLGYCIALGGSTKPLDAEINLLLKKTPLNLFLPDFDKAGVIAWIKWRQMFPNIQRILTLHGKSVGDYVQEGGNLREWLLDNIQKLKNKIL